MLDFVEDRDADWGSVVAQGAKVAGSGHEEGDAGAGVGGGGEEPFSEGWVTAGDGVADLEDEVWVYMCWRLAMHLVCLWRGAEGGDRRT
jgi:hypothetical protein